MLELKDFIRKTLVDVIEGVHEAAQDLKTSGKGYIVPSSYTGTSNNLRASQLEKKEIEFDIAIQVQEAESTKKGSSAELDIGGKIIVASAKGNITGESSKSNEESKETNSRIKFVVPIGFKTTAYK